MTPIERLRQLQKHLLSLDSGSGEAADLAKIIAVFESTKEFRTICNGPVDEDSAARESLVIERMDANLAALEQP